MTDDAIREIHGVRCRQLGYANTMRVVTYEAGDDEIIMERPQADVSLTEWQARYLAAKLYRLARRVRQRRLGLEAAGEGK